MDLEFLAATICEWPDANITSVRLDSDGEICFEPNCDYDFYPDDLATAAAVFESGGECKQRGREYTKEEWEQTRVRTCNDRHRVNEY